MPRKPRITAVPIEQVQGEEGLLVARDASVLTVPVSDQREEKTDAEHMTDIIKEVQEEPKAEEHKEAVSEAPVVVKPKAKRASRAKPKEEPVKEEPKEEPKEEVKEEVKIDDKVACPDWQANVSEDIEIQSRSKLHEQETKNEYRGKTTYHTK